MENENIMLSIYVPVYNHEKYVVQALNSILMQETQYKYEVLVGEDCSTDNTRNVLKSYEKEHPNKFKIFYREKNMNNSDCNNGLDLKRRCIGKYIICLEGDDYWTDKYKIEKQINFLENNPEYIAVAHKCTVVDENSQPNGETYPECLDINYTFEHYVSDILPGQTATVLCRNYMNMKHFDKSILEKGLIPGDRLLYFSLLCHGKIYCMPDKMSAYRHITNGGSSFSATYKYDYNTTEQWHRELLNYSYNIKKAERYTEVLYLEVIYIAVRRKYTDLKTAIYTIKKNIRNKHKALYFWIKFKINKQIFHKKIYL